MDRFVDLKEIPLGAEVIVRGPDERTVAGRLEAIEPETRTVVVSGVRVAFPEEQP